MNDSSEQRKNGAAMNAQSKVIKRLTKDNLRAAIGRNLKAARECLEESEPITQDQVAKMFTPPLTRAAIAQWEVGDTLPDVDRLAVLSKLYGVTIDSIVFGAEEVIDIGTTLTPDAIKMARNWMSLGQKKRALVVSLILQLKSP